jgi:signal transduction histidine kinase/CheY-like chemotaxis protein
MKFWHQSLTTKVANYFLLLALIVVGVVGGVAHLRAREALKQAAFNRLRVAATLKEEEISRWFEDQQRDFLLITQLPDVQTKLKILLAQNITPVEYQRNYRLLGEYLRDLAEIKPNLREIFILDRSNKIILSTKKEREGQYEILANITYVEKIQIGEAFSPIFYVSPFTGKPAVTLAKPIRNQQGKREGMAIANLGLERIDRIVRERTGLGNSGETYLVGSLVSKNTFIAREPNKTQEYPEGITSAGIDNAMSGISGYGLYRNYAGVPVIGVYRWLNEQDLALIVEMSQEEAFAPARELASTIIVVGLVSVLGLLIGVNWLSRQLDFSRQQLENYSHQLEIKAQEAEAANRAKSVFLANMSHELRTPLNAILGFAQLMGRDSSINLQQQESLAIINRSGEHLLNLINDVLEMSKIEAGRIVLNPEPFELLRLLQTLQEMFQIRAEEKQLALNFILADDLPQYIVSDCRKLRQVLINLLSNAVKFTQTGGVTLKAKAKGQESDEGKNLAYTLYFQVSDTGKGIAPEELDNLFQPFIQTASGIQSEGGTGLGLAISRQFIQLMGGEIWVSSTLGEGSNFSFEIEVLAAEESQIKTPATKKLVTSIAPNQPSYRILVVDDRPANRQVLMQLLETVGFLTRTANNGKEAIALWQEWQPHLIWMDMRMPVMDGYQATEQIKKQPQGKDTIVIALTASAFEEQRAKILEAGCDDFVSKPFNEDIIFEKMSEHLGVEYLYTAESRFVDSTLEVITQESLGYEDLSFMSDKWIEQLQQAAIAVDADLILQLIAEIPENYASVAQALTELTRNYDFDRIIQLTEKQELAVEE